MLRYRNRLFITVIKTLWTNKNMIRIGISPNASKLWDELNFLRLWGVYTRWCVDTCFWMRHFHRQIDSIFIGPLFKICTLHSRPQIKLDPYWSNLSRTTSNKQLGEIPGSPRVFSLQPNPSGAPLIVNSSVTLPRKSSWNAHLFI